jgi:hypothetical protein
MNHQSRPAEPSGLIPPKPVPPPNIELHPGIKIPMPKLPSDYSQIRRP